jgi:hypothetical protein
MTKSTLLAISAAGLLLGATTAFAQTDSPGASGYAPGQQDRSGTDRGASSSAPGQRAKDEGGAAKDYAPGQQMKKPETSGSAAEKANQSKDPKQKSQ